MPPTCNQMRSALALQPAWHTQVPPGIDPCLPKNLLNVFTLATQEVRLTPAALKTAAGANPSPVVEIADTEPPTDTLEGSNNWVIAPSKVRHRTRHHGQRSASRLFGAKPALHLSPRCTDAARDRRERTSASRYLARDTTTPSPSGTPSSPSTRRTSTSTS